MEVVVSVVEVEVVVEHQHSSAAKFPEELILLDASNGSLASD